MAEPACRAQDRLGRLLEGAGNMRNLAKVVAFAVDFGGDDVVRAGFDDRLIPRAERAVRFLMDARPCNAAAGGVAE